MPLNLKVKTNTIPAGFCFNGYNSSSYLDLIDLLYVQFPSDLSLINTGSDTPAPDRRDRPWYRSNADGTPDRWYQYAMGSWLSLHPTAPGAVIMYEGSEASIDTFDGGEAGPVTTISGPMWERVTQMDAKFPIGPGTTPAAPAGTGTVIAVGDQGGEELHVLVTAELAKHTHQVGSRDSTADSGAAVAQEFVADFGYAGAGAGPPATSSEVGADAGHNTMPPYNAIWFIRRTGRLFFRI